MGAAVRDSRDLEYPHCQHNGWDFDRDLSGFPSPLALQSVHLGLKATLYRPNHLNLPPDLSSKLMNLMLDLGMKLTLYRQSQLNLPLGLGAKVSGLGKRTLVAKFPRRCSEHGSTCF